MAESAPVPAEPIQRRILVLRGQRVLLDRDLASLYGVTTKRLMEQVRRNLERFPEDFCFQIDHQEFVNLRSQFATSSSRHGGVRRHPFAFTERGALMAANVLQSPEAGAMSTNALPIMEAGGVDLCLTSHSHSYERSFLLDGHYGVAGTLKDKMKHDAGNGRPDGKGAYRKATFGPGVHEGAVYVVAGSSGKITGKDEKRLARGFLDHPAMFISLYRLGSMVLDVNGNRLDATFLSESGEKLDYFSIIKGR